MITVSYKLIFVLLLSSALGDDCSDKLDKDVYIRIEKTKWALDGVFTDEKDVRLMEYILPSNDQRWRFEPSSNIGYFNIINKKTKKALDISSEYDFKSQSYYVRTNDFKDSPSQQWMINWDGTITNAYAEGHVLDTYKHQYSDRNHMIVTRRRRNNNTKFFLTRKMTDCLQDFCIDI